MEVPGAHIGLVDPLAAGVTNRGLVPFPDFMRFLRPLVLLPFCLLLTAPVVAAEDSTPTPSASAASPSPLPPSPSPSPLPTPVNAFLSLDVTAGPASTVINVSGGQFLPNQQLNLYWDQASHVAGAATADANGSFNTRVKPFAGDKPGVHKLCAGVLPNPCANFALQAATPSPSPTPEESPSPLPSASPTSNPTFVATPARTSNNLSGFDVISRPPFVFLPIFGVGFLLLGLGYWAISYIRRPRRLAPVPTAAVVHRATRPDYSAAFGTPPPRPSDAPQQSAWNESMQPRSTPSHVPTPRNIIRAQGAELPAPPTEHHAWGPGEPDTGYPDLSSPEMHAREDLPEAPQPGD
jgi:hypothetical protein